MHQIVFISRDRLLAGPTFVLGPDHDEGLLYPLPPIALPETTLGSRSRLADRTLDLPRVPKVVSDSATWTT